MRMLSTSMVPSPTLAVVCALGVFGLVGCAQFGRVATEPAADIGQASVLGIPNARYLGDGDPAPMIAEFRRAYAREAAYFSSVHRPLPDANYLAISGGGDNGAFGAGVLVGWSEHGTRPVFKGVTGVSAGALLAPFAFVGPEYDPVLSEILTNIDQTNVFEKRPIIAAIGSDAMADTTPLSNLIAKYVDERMVADIAREYGRGRLLFIATTNLDAGRPVIWNIGAIAQSGNPDALKLIRKVLLASAAIPAAFPPVMFDVTYQGTTYQELHVDGGAIAQAFLYPPSIAVGKLGGIGPKRSRTAYIIRNGKLRVDAEQTERKTLSIATRAVSALAASSGVGDLYRIYTTTKRDGVQFRLAFIEDDFTEAHDAEFDRTYMNRLFEYARAKAQSGYPWRRAPPGLAE
jgi:predicted patatin/cPLA2 family phospholipase